MNPGEAFLGLLEAAMKDAATQDKVSFLQITINPIGIPTTVRVVTLPERPVTLTKEQIQSEINRVLREGDGFHYSSDGLRIVVMREIGSHQFPPGAFGAPDTSQN